MFRLFLCRGILATFAATATTVCLAATDSKAILDEAYQDELKAYIRYEAVVEQFGAIRPFVNLVEAERRHLDHLADLYIARGFTPAAVIEPAPVMYLSVASACQVSLDAERENVALLDRLLAETTEPDIKATLEWIREASAGRHIPALERCSGLPG